MKGRLPKRERPAIPDRVKIAVATRQLWAFKASISAMCRNEGETQPKYLARLLALLAEFMGCTAADLHCDHNPPLRARPYDPTIENVAARYTPNANDPDYLEFMPVVDHRLKTNVRGKGAQHPDRVLIKRQRKLDKIAAGIAPRQKAKIRSRSAWPKGRKIQSRPFNRKTK